MLKSKPQVSVIMPTYNTNETYLKTAIESILNQSLEDFEFIIIDDGSVENDYAIVNSYEDKRIKAYKNKENLGVAGTLNKALSLAQGKYIARMDADDISNQDRLKTTVEFFDQHPDIDICGSFVKTFDAKNKKQKFFEDNLDIRAQLFFTSPFAHPSVTFRKTAIEKYNIRYEEKIKAEDYRLWSELAKNKAVKFANIPEYLLNYRIHPEQITKSDKNVIDSGSKVVDDLLDFIDCDLEADKRQLFIDFSRFKREFSAAELKEIDKLLLDIIENYNIEKITSKAAAYKVFNYNYAKTCLRQKLVYDDYHAKIYKDSAISKKSKLNTKYKTIISLLDIIA